MYVRRTLTKGSPDRIEDAKRIIKDTAVPMVQELPGFLGGYWLADPKTGEGLSVTFFDSEEALEATAQKAEEIRTTTTQKIGGLEVLGVEHLEVIASTGDKVHRSAMAARVINFESDPAKVEDGIRNFNENVIPGVSKIPGFQGGFWAVNRSTGKGFGVTLAAKPALRTLFAVAIAVSHEHRSRIPRVDNCGNSPCTLESGRTCQTPATSLSPPVAPPRPLGHAARRVPRTRTRPRSA